MIVAETAPYIHCRYQLFGRPFVKRLENLMCYQTVVCPVCLSVALDCGQTVGWIKMKLGKQIGLGPGHIVLDGDPALLKEKGWSPHFSAHVCCGQTVGWIKMLLGTEVST